MPVRFGEEKRLCASYSIPDGARLRLSRCRARLGDTPGFVLAATLAQTPGAPLVRLCSEGRQTPPTAENEILRAGKWQGLDCAERMRVAVGCSPGGRDVRSSARDLPQRERRQMVSLPRRRQPRLCPAQSQRVIRRNGDEDRTRRLSRKGQSGSRASSARQPDRQSRRRGLIRRLVMRARLKAKEK